MSRVNIRRVVENIRASTNVYTPVVETIVNAIQAIDERDNVNGRITVKAIRSGQRELNSPEPEITGFTIHDNGIGFTDKHRDSFDTLYTDHRITEGGKGFGRFTCLKYFEDLHVVSTYVGKGSEYRSRKFSMGKNQEIIIDEVDESISQDSDTISGTLITLSQIKNKHKFEKSLNTIAKQLVERLLPYFITKDYKCPEILLLEKDGARTIRLNDFVSNEVSPFIHEITVESPNFSLNATKSAEQFQVRVFKIFSPNGQKSRISLVAHKREVSTTKLEKYVPEFADDFYEDEHEEDSATGRNYIIKVYVFGTFLDQNVSLERGDFEFDKEYDLIHGISQENIEANAARIAQEAVGKDITLRKSKKRERVQKYVDEEAPWHKEILSKIDLSKLPYNPSENQIETYLQQEKLKQELDIKGVVAKLLSEDNFAEIQESVVEIVGKISDTSKNDLIHYIALRRKILDIFKKSLEVDESGTYSAEGVVHDIIFPRKRDTEGTSYEDHNLWIIDERLNFTTYVASDKPIGKSGTARPDLLVYDNRVLFRGTNEMSNPVTIFEFKRPQRDDFVNQPSSEDPVQQLIRYANQIRDGHGKTPEGRNVLVTQTTPFYGYIICDITPKIESWLEREKNFKPMPDRLGWFQWIDNINLYVEFISWQKVVTDAHIRNKIFFQKLGI